MRAQRRRKTLLRRLVVWLVAKGLLPPLLLKLHAGRRPILLLRAAWQRVGRRFDHLLSAAFNVDLEDDSAFFDGGTAEGRAAIVRKCKLDALLRYARTESSLRLPVLSWLDASQMRGTPQRRLSAASQLTATSAGLGGAFPKRGAFADASASLGGGSRLFQKPPPPNTPDAPGNPPPSGTGSSILLFPSQGFSQSNDIVEELAEVDPALAEVIDQSEELIAVQEVGILFEQYHCATWWWEIVVRSAGRCAAAGRHRRLRMSVLSRSSTAGAHQHTLMSYRPVPLAAAAAAAQELAKKVLFTSLLTFVGRGKVVQVIFGLVLSFFLVMFYQAVGPFASRATNRVGLSTSISLFLYLMVALMLKTNAELEVGWMSVFVITLTVGTPAAALLIVMFTSE